MPITLVFWIFWDAFLNVIFGYARDKNKNQNLRSLHERDPTSHRSTLVQTGGDWSPFLFVCTQLSPFVDIAIVLNYRHIHTPCVSLLHRSA